MRPTTRKKLCCNARGDEGIEHVGERLEADGMIQELPHPDLPHHEEAQPPHTHHDPGSERHRAHRLCAIRCVSHHREEGSRANTSHRRFWKGEEAAVEGTGRQGDRAASVGPREVDHISADTRQKEMLRECGRRRNGQNPGLQDWEVASVHVYNDKCTTCNHQDDE
jgi:hypothetical protein